MTHLKAYAGALVAFLAIDAVWLGFIAAEFYRDRLGHLMGDTPDMVTAAVFYLFYICGVVYFAILPALRIGSLRMATLNGAALGFVAYGTYDFTNYATLRDWPPQVVAVDLAWGTVLTAAAATAGYIAARR